MEIAQFINWWHAWGEILFLCLDVVFIILVLIFSKLKNNKVWWWVGAMFLLTALIIPDLVNRKAVNGTLVLLAFISSIIVPILFVFFMIFGNWRNKTEEIQYGNVGMSVGPPISAQPIVDDTLESTVSEKEQEEIGESEKTKIVKRERPVFAWLVGMSGKMTGKSFDVSLEVTSIGRSSQNDIVLDDDSVSKEHSKIKYYPENDAYKLFDLVSTNGTYYKGKRIETPVEIKDGDEIEFGEALFTFKCVNRESKEKEKNQENE